MTKALTSFIIRLTLLLGTSFFIHAWVQHTMHIGFYQENIIVCYLFNYILTGLFFFILLAAERKNSKQIGFIFLYSSLVKYLLFFFIIYPGFNSTEGLKSAEFAAFFIPYSLGMFAEIVYLIRVLNK